MRLFGSKKDTPVNVSENDLDIQKIPDIFYGGNNPVIYEQSVKGQSTAAAAPGRIAQSSEKFPLPAVSSQKRRSILVILIVILGILVVGGASAYYIYQYRSAQHPTTNQSTSVSKTSSSTAINTIRPTSTPGISTSTTSSTILPPTSTPSLVSNFLEFPPVNLGNTADTDLDQLTDVEEVMYAIDSGTWDTDKDGYYDGQEVLNLYNPKGFAPVKLIDSGLVREYVNPLSGYRMYYPLQWQKGSVDTEEKQVLFSSISGEYIEVRVFQKSLGDTFQKWFQLNAPNEQFNLLTPFTNRFGVNGLQRNDGLVSYFDTSSTVFVILYHQRDVSAPIPYRSTVEMVVQSFRPTATTQTIPDQEVLVPPTDVTTSSSMNTLSVTTSQQ